KSEDKKLADAIRIGYLEGMVDFNENLRQLVERGDITREVALEVSPNPDNLKMVLKGIKVATPGILCWRKSAKPPSARRLRSSLGPRSLTPRLRASMHPFHYLESCDTTSA